MRLARLSSVFLRCVVSLALCLCVVSAAQACPMCAESVAADDHLPKAYMYSILFMLAMPAAVFSGVGTAIYLTIRKHQAAQAEPAETVSVG